MDDEALQMRALCETLRDHGYETLGAPSGQAALAALKEGKFDLLLTDLNMPEMDGIALLRAAMTVDPDLVGVVMTGQGTITAAVESMKQGALDFILKPFKVSVILPVISRALAMRRLRQENSALQQRIRERTVELEAANENLDAFASSVAHDLHAPARHITSFAELILEDHAAELSPVVRRHLGAIARAGERMGLLISNLLAFSRLARVEMNLLPVDLTAIVARARRDLQEQRDVGDTPDIKSAIAWKTGSLPTVRADGAMMQQVFFNLLSNAVKYTRGRTAPEIEIGCRSEESGEWTIFVRDNGVGFDMAHADKLFGMFQRLHSAEQFEGNGVGLASVRRIIQRHGGRIWAEAEPEKGATFYFTLPGAAG